eukprot:scaffold212324_cov23-Tisochrysis_lutea.AAC.1
MKYLAALLCAAVDKKVNVQKHDDSLLALCVYGTQVVVSERAARELHAKRVLVAGHMLEGTVKAVCILPRAGAWNACIKLALPSQAQS